MTIEAVVEHFFIISAVSLLQISFVYKKKITNNETLKEKSNQICSLQKVTEKKEFIVNSYPQHSIYAQRMLNVFCFSNKRDI